MTNLMTSPLSAPCACGQPWETHHLRCPRQKHRGRGKVIALALAGGIALQLLFVLAVLDFGGLLRPITTADVLHAALAGPTQPRVPACEEFYAWKRTHRPTLLNHAVADAYG